MREDEMGRACITHAKEENCIGKLQGKELQERRRRRWEGNIDMHRMGCCGLDTSHSRMDRGGLL
jgi:hypothetical protein